MFPFSQEYSQPVIGQSKCSYSNLASTYAGRSADMQFPTMATYQVPAYCPDSMPGMEYPPAYDTLTRSNGGCGGYANLKRAFPLATCTSCQGVAWPSGYNPAGNTFEPTGQFSTRACAGGPVAACVKPPVAPSNMRRSGWF